MCLHWFWLVSWIQLPEFFTFFHFHAKIEVSERMETQQIESRFFLPSCTGSKTIWVSARPMLSLVKLLALLVLHQENVFVFIATHFICGGTRVYFKMNVPYWSRRYIIGNFTRNDPNSTIYQAVARIFLLGWGGKGREQSMDSTYHLR